MYRKVLYLLILSESLYGCKPTSSPLPQSKDLAPQTEVGQDPLEPRGQQPETTKAPSPDIVISLFDDGERIYTFPNNYLENARKIMAIDATAETPGADGQYFDESTFLYDQAQRIEQLVASAIKEKQVTKQTSPANALALDDNDDANTVMLGTFIGTVAIGILMVPTRTKIEAFESAQASFRQFTQGADYRQTYFTKAIEKKWAADGSKFADMAPVTSSVLKRLDVDIADVKSIGDRVSLGVLPNEKILADMKMKATLSGQNTYDLVSVIEDFEMDYAVKNLNVKTEAVIDTSKIGAKQVYGDGRFRMEIITSGGPQSLGINKWVQYSTPDRTMMTNRVLEGAIADVLGAMKENKMIYVHCKSGKGRSATVVVGARVAYLIDMAAQKGKAVTGSLLDELIEEQIAQVKAQRSEIGISAFQKYNLREVLTQRAGIDKSKID